MKSNYLLPYRFKTVGWFIFITGLVLGFISFFIVKEPTFLDCKVFALSEIEFLGKHKFIEFIENNIFDEIISVFIIVGAIFVAFSKEKQEDEYISKIRLESLLWATYINYFILLFTIVFFYGGTFFWVMIFNMFTILFVFIIRFKWALWKFKNSQNEK
jgi:hypothetical protein